MLAKVNGSEIRKSGRALAERSWVRASARWTPRPRTRTRSFLIDMKIVSKAAEDKVKVQDPEDFKKGWRSPAAGF